MRLAFFIKIFLICVLVKNSQQGWFSSITNAIKKAADAVVETAKNIVQSIKDISYSFLDPNNEYVSGTCEYGGRSWSCTATAGNHWALRISGNAGNVPEEFRNGGDIVFPYCHITDVSSTTYSWVDSFLRNTNRSYTISINRLGATSSLVIKQNHPDPVNRFVNNINAYKGTLLNVLRVSRDAVNRNYEAYTVESQFVNSKYSDYNNNKAAIAQLNQELSAISASLSTATTQRDNLSLSNTGRNSVLANRMSERERLQKIWDNCTSESASIGNLLNTYLKYKEEYTEDKVYELLNMEYTNLCKFQIAAEDVILILPHQKLEINRVRKELARNRNYEALDKLFDEDEFFIQRDLTKTS